MPQPRREQSRDTSVDIAARIVNGPDPDRVSFSQSFAIGIVIWCFDTLLIPISTTILTHISFMPAVLLPSSGEYL